EKTPAAVILTTGKRRVVDLEGHADGGLVHRQCGQRFDIRRIADRVGYAQILDAADCDYVAGLRGIHFAPLQAHEAEHLQDFSVALPALAIDDRDRHVRLHRAALHAAHADHADVGV